MNPETRYATNREVSIAYRVLGEGPVDVLVVPGIVSHVETFHELPGYSKFLARLARFARVITFDKRGNGLSDRLGEAPNLFERMDDVRAVLDAAGSKRTVLLGMSEGSAMSILFAARYPERAQALIVFGAFSKMLASPDYPAGFPLPIYEQFTRSMVENWGTGLPLIQLFGPSFQGSPEVQAIAARCERMSATPTALSQLWRMNASLDVRDTLPKIRVPALVMHRKNDRVVPIAAGRFIAERIAGARLVELEGEDHFPFAGDFEPVIEEIEAMLEVEAETFVEATAIRAAEERPPAETGFDRLLAQLAFDEPIELDRFSVVRPLGQGGMGAVFLARDRHLGRSVAIKVLTSSDVAAFRRFRREAMAVARLSHPNVVQIYELGLDARVPYLVMEYVPGGTPAGASQAIDWRRATAIVASAARGLGAAHAVGIVHRDVKPSNLLLIDRTGAEVKVADFGVAKLAGAEPLTKAAGVLGTIGYLAPEQARGEPVDARADVYALAVTWFRLLAGRKPFEGTPAEVIAQSLSTALPDPRAVVPELPSALAELAIAMGSLDPARRPIDGNAVAAAIDAARS